MITIEFNGRALEITASEERALRLLRSCQWAAPKSHFEEGPRKWRRYIAPVSQRAKDLGVFEESRYGMEYSDREGVKYPTRARAFFSKNARHNQVVMGNARRINAILHAIDTIRARMVAA